MAAEVVRAFMVSWLLGHGYQDFQAEAIVRRAWVESRFEPCIVSRSGSYLLQWSGPRLRNLYAFAGTKGCPSLAMQVAFADRELRTERAYRCFWNASHGQAYAVFSRTFAHGRRC